MITVAIPTYNRGAILVETIARLLSLTPPPSAIVIADQTREHLPDVDARLRAWDNAETIRWLRLPQPSIPHAMNEALLAATTPLVLFVDDDIVPASDLAGAHARAHADPSIWAVAGQVLEPGEEPEEYRGSGDDLEFRFNSTRGRTITSVMALNLSVKRDRALGIGGFDEHFIAAAYRFETDFAMRLTAAGGVVWFEPAASVRHLKLSSGGLRSFGDHRTTASPAHCAGDYYFALHHIPRFARYAARRMMKNIATRYHATHPWSIPGKIVAEFRGLLLARKLFRKGRKLLTVQQPGNPATRQP